MEKIFVSVKELSQATGLKVGTIYRMAKAGKLPYYSVGVRGRGMRFRISEVLDALRASFGEEGGEGDAE